MTRNDKLYELIVKKLTSDITVDENSRLEKETKENLSSGKKFTIVKEFWNNFFHKPKSHTIIERTEKKLGFTYRPNLRAGIRNLFIIAATVLLILSVIYSAYYTFKPKRQITLNEYVTARWHDGIFCFYDDDLFSITKKLERKFHTPIFIADSLVGKPRFSAEFDEKPLTKILDLLKKAHNFEYRLNEYGINKKNQVIY